MSSRLIRISVLAILLLPCAAKLVAQMPNAYGANITLEAAKKPAAAALAEAAKNKWTMAVAVVDTGGTLV